MKQFIKRKLHESFTYDLIETLMGEDYPSSFDMEKFKSLTSFAARKRYCGEHLQRISSGSSRIVYKIDDDKVLKLAFNNKGIAQNEVEVGASRDYLLTDTVAEVYDVDENDLWIEMQLARKVNKGNFSKIVGMNWDDYIKAVHNYGLDASGGRGGKYELSPEVEADMWENEFVTSIFDYIGNWGIPAGDLQKSSSYGVVKKNGQDDIVLIDYGLTSDVYDSYYS